MTETSFVQSVLSMTMQNFSLPYLDQTLQGVVAGRAVQYDTVTGQLGYLIRLLLLCVLEKDEAKRHWLVRGE